jgi:hypothetical protein
MSAIALHFFAHDERLTWPMGFIPTHQIIKYSDAMHNSANDGNLMVLQKTSVIYSTENAIDFSFLANHSTFCKCFARQMRMSRVVARPIAVHL